MGLHLLSALSGVSGPDTVPTLASGVDDPSAAATGFQPNVLDMLIPGFSLFSAAVQRYLHIDLNVYIPLFLTSWQPSRQAHSEKYHYYLRDQA